MSQNRIFLSCIVLVGMVFSLNGNAEVIVNTPLQTLTGHTNDARSIVFSPDGGKVLTGSADNTLKLWDSNTGNLIRTFSGHTNGVQSVAYSPDGTKVLSGSRDDTAKLWDVSTGQEIRTFTWHSDWITAVDYSPDGTKVLTGTTSGYSVVLGDVNTGAVIRAYDGHTNYICDVKFSPDGTKVLTGSDDRTAKLWNTDTGDLIRTFSGHSDWVGSVAFSSDGTRILTGSADHTAKLWNANTGELIRTYAHSNVVWDVAFSPDGSKVLTACADHTAKLWDAYNGMLLCTYSGHTDRVLSVAFSPDGKRIATGSSYPDNTAKLWDANPFLEIISPNGGETWQAGTTHDIVYSATGNIQSVSIYYSTNAGSAWNFITGPVSVSFGNNTYSWLIPSASSTACLVRVSRATDWNEYDVCDNLFNIQYAAPAPRSDTALFYDHNKNRLMLYGGFTAGAVYQSDLWEFDLNTYLWKELSPSWIPPGKILMYPNVSQSAKKALTYGYHEPDLYGPTGYLDLITNNWQNAYALTEPTTRHGGYMMVYDSTRDRFYMITYDYPNPEWGVWWYDFASNEWHKINATGSPYNRYSSAVIYDPNVDKIIVFGGFLHPGGSASDETWLFDLSSFNWTQSSCAIHPPASTLSRFVYDTARNLILLNDPVHGNVWIYNTAADTWIEKAPFYTPVYPRTSYNATTFATSTGKMYMFGGSIPGSATLVEPNEAILWEYNPVTNQWAKAILGNPSNRIPMLSLSPTALTLPRNQNVEIAVNISDATGVVGYRVALDLDPSKVSYVVGSATKAGTSTENGWGPLVINSASPELAIFTCASATGALGSGPATLMKFQLHVNGSLADYTPISVTFNPLTSLNEDAIAYSAEIWSATVLGPNHRPSFTGGPNQVVLEDSGYHQVNNWATNIQVGPGYESWQSLYFTLDIDKPQLFFGSPTLDATGTLRYTLATDEFGICNATAVLHDSGGTANGGIDSSTPYYFSITVKPVNDAPSFIAGATAVVLNATGGQHTFKNWATGISAGPPNESTQSLWFQVQTNHPELFSATPVIAPSGTLLFTPAVGAHGVVKATATLYDNGGIADGGINKSSPAVFVIKIYIPFLWGDLNANGQAGAVDASLILRYHAGWIDTFPGYPVAEYPEYYPDPTQPWNYFPMAADVNADGMAATLDASLILQKYVWLIPWFPADTNHDQWGPDAPLPPGKRLKRSTSRTMNAILEPAANAWYVTFRIDDAEEVQGMRAVLYYDPAQVQFNEAESGWLVDSGLMVANDSEPGRLILAGALGAPLQQGACDLLGVKFDAVGDGSVPLRIEIDEEQTAVNDGHIRIQLNYPDAN